jgi:hypothetical protein
MELLRGKLVPINRKTSFDRTGCFILNVTILKINKKFLKEWLINFDHPVVSKFVNFLLKNCLASGVDRFLTILPFAMVLSQANNELLSISLICILKFIIFLTKFKLN